MNSLFVAMMLMAAASQVAAQSLQECYNGVGVFQTETPSPGSWWWETCPLIAGPGEFDLYVVLLNPWNEVTDNAPTSISGFEIRIEWPETWYVTPHLPDGWINAAIEPDFACSGAGLPVINDQCVLMRLQCGTLTTDGRDVYVRPLADVSLQSISGEIAVRDASDQSVSRATPMYYDYDLPVIGTYPCSPVLDQAPASSWGDCWNMPLENSPHSWGDIKAMYR